MILCAPATRLQGQLQEEFAIEGFHAAAHGLWIRVWGSLCARTLGFQSDC